MSLLGQIRLLGVRRGFRMWRCFTAIGPDADRIPELRIHHGAKPSLTGYRRTKS